VSGIPAYPSQEDSRYLKAKLCIFLSSCMCPCNSTHVCASLGRSPRGDLVTIPRHRCLQFFHCLRLRGHCKLGDDAPRTMPHCPIHLRLGTLCEISGSTIRKVRFSAAKGCEPWQPVLIPASSCVQSCVILSRVIGHGILFLTMVRSSHCSSKTNRLWRLEIDTRSCQFKPAHHLRASNRCLYKPS
jgi:hypothetical protein